MTNHKKYGILTTRNKLTNRRHKVKKLIGTLIFTSLLFCFSQISYAGGVIDNNDGDKGDILVSTGQNNGANSTGTWTDPSFLKGDKGDTGATGPQGHQGLTGAMGSQGNQGIQGIQGPKGDIGASGPQGQQGLTGAMGFQGIQGLQGLTGAVGSTGPQGTPGLIGAMGPQGTKGDNGINGTNGANGTNGSKGDIGSQGLQGIQGLIGANGKDVDPATINRLDNRIDDVNNRVRGLEKTQYVAHGELILQQGRRHKIGVYGEYNTTRHTVSEVGVSITIALDDSYEMKEIDKLNKRIERLNQKLESQDIETETVKEGNTTVIRIKQKEGVLKLMGKF